MFFDMLWLSTDWQWQLALIARTYVEIAAGLSVFIRLHDHDFVWLT